MKKKIDCAYDIDNSCKNLLRKVIDKVVHLNQNIVRFVIGCFHTRKAIKFLKTVYDF